MTEWVKRNEDKPHRCPRCHAIADRANSERPLKPRTKLVCPRDCEIQWRYGLRQLSLGMDLKSFMKELRETEVER